MVYCIKIDIQIMNHQKSQYIVSGDYTIKTHSDIVSGDYTIKTRIHWSREPMHTDQEN